jgi:predicted enzyme related to lactoylglutathione lyase
MIFEHFALNVPDAAAMATWYVKNFGLRIVRQRDEAPYTRFLADETGRVFLEIYSNPAAPYPDYAAQHELVFHWAMVSRDPDDERVKLEAAGAKLLKAEDLPDGSRLLMLRDPWGVAFQLCRRTTAMPMA